jgi:hypothetical protein
MTGTKVKRSQFQTFLNTTPLSTATYKLIGSGVSSSKINYNPKTSEETYVSDDTASISVENYAPVMPVEMTALNGDDAFEFVDALRKTRAVLSAAETDIVNVWMYETGGPTAYPAEKQPVCIQIDDFGGDGGVAVKINYTINFVGAPTTGTFNATTKAFTSS